MTEKKVSSNGELVSSALDMTVLAVRAALDQKALDVRVLSLEGVSDVADFFIIASGTSERHVRGIAEKLEEVLAREGLKALNRNGYESAKWILLDYGDVVAHVFYEPTRQYYEFDKLWQKAKSLALTPELEKEAQRLRTGIKRD